MDRQTVFDYIRKKYKTLPEYPWRRYDENAVFRHADNKKWFALVMGLQADKIGGRGDAWIDVVNLKIDDMFFRDMILQEDVTEQMKAADPLMWTARMNSIRDRAEEIVMQEVVRAL